MAGRLLNGPDTYENIREEPFDVVAKYQIESENEIPRGAAQQPETTHFIELPGQRRAPALVVAVNGAVRRPGVYDFEENARVQDGIRAAGGVTEDADLDDINIAARLMDNTTLCIPFKVFRHQERHSLVARRTPGAAESNPARYTRSGWAQNAPPVLSKRADTAVHEAPRLGLDSSDAQPERSGASNLINLNHATLAELQKLPGVGPKTAEKIDAYRKIQPFRTVDELEAVHGIGEKRMEALRGLVTVE